MGRVLCGLLCHDPRRGILAVYRKLPYGLLYLIGYAPPFVASGMLVVVAQTSLISRFSTALLIIPWIVVIHVLVIDLSLGMMARRAQSNLARERRIAMEKSRFTVVGETIGMVVHQWQTPPWPGWEPSSPNCTPIFGIRNG